MKTIKFYTCRLFKHQTWAERNINEFSELCGADVIDSYIPEENGKVFSEDDRIYYCIRDNGTSILVPKKWSV